MEDRATSPFLAVQDLVVGYGGTPVLSGLSLAVARGELVALLGSSGCGKTTLLRAVCGFVPVSGGRILVEGQDVSRLPPERRHMALVFQSYALWPHMTAAQNIGYGLKVRGWPRERIRARIGEMLALLQLDGLAERNVTQLSGGQRQRVALGRALAVEPALLLLDEPLSNLDARIRHELRHEIRGLQQRLGITALHVTHDREEAMVMADRIVIMQAGQIAQIGTPEDLWHRPASPFVASFMGADNVVEVEAEIDAAAASIAPGAYHAAARIELRAAGAHAVARGRGRFAAHFRGAAAGLADPAGRHEGLVLRGRVAQAAYLGEAWRHGIVVGGRQFLVDAPRRHAEGEAVSVAIPAEALHLFPIDGTASPVEAKEEVEA